MNKLKKSMAGAACCCMAVLLGVGMMRGNQIEPAAPDTLDPPAQSNIIKNPTDLSSQQHPEQESLEWLSADEILKTDDDAYMGVCVPSFTAWQGGFYHGTESTSADRFAPTDDELWFNPEYRYKVYQLKDSPDRIAIRMNGGLQVYQKAFDVTFEVDGVTYGIQYSPVMDADCTAGNQILSGEGFTVYEAVRLQGEAPCQEYLVNILPLLKEQWPDLFGDDQDYGEAWQMAIPLDEQYTDVPVAENPGSTGALVAYDEVWGGSYTDENGNMVIWLTENTPENQQEVFQRNPELNKENTVFKTADYSHAYLTELLADISQAMGNKELPFVPTAALRDGINRVVVTMTTDDADSREQVLAFDTIGGAIEIEHSSGMAQLDVLVLPK